MQTKWMLLACLILCRIAFADLPTSVYLDINDSGDYPAGVCYLSSLGQLIQYADSSITQGDILVRTGMITQFEWSNYNGGIVGVHKRVYDSGNNLYQGQTMDLIRLCGFGYAVCYGKGGGGGVTLVKGADQVFVFTSEDDAVVHLKTVLASGVPVQVHLDFSYVKDDAGVYYPFWASYPDEASSHFVVIHGYDEDYVYYTDNQPSQAIDVDNDGQTDGIGVGLPWGHFLEAWEAGEDINTDSNLQGGPWFMLYLTSVPVLSENEDLLGYLYRDGYDGPEVLRIAIGNIQQGKTTTACFTDSLRGRKMEMTPYMIQWLEDNNYTEIADLYSQMNTLWQSIRNTQIDEATVLVAIGEIADLLEQSWEDIEPLANLEYDIYPLVPGSDSTFDGLDAVTLRWAPDPYLKSVQLEVDPAGDFSNSKTIIKFKVSAGKAFYVLTVKDWLKILAKENGDRSLKWRVVGTSKGAASASEAQTLSWVALAMTATAPDDHFSTGSDQCIDFSFASPSVAKAAAVEISTTSDFTNKKCLVTLKAKKGLTTVTLKNSVLVKFLQKDDGDNVLYWRVIDTGSKKTTVESSEFRSLLINP